MLWPSSLHDHCFCFNCFSVIQLAKLLSPTPGLKYVGSNDACNPVVNCELLMDYCCWICCVIGWVPDLCFWPFRPDFGWTRERERERCSSWLRKYILIYTKWQRMTNNEVVDGPTGQTDHPQIGWWCTRGLWHLWWNQWYPVVLGLALGAAWAAWRLGGCSRGTHGSGFMPSLNLLRPPVPLDRGEESIGTISSSRWLPSPLSLLATRTT